MNAARLEQANPTVRDPRATADLLCRLFDWHVRWKGAAIHDAISKIGVAPGRIASGLPRSP